MTNTNASNTQLHSYIVDVKNILNRDDFTRYYPHFADEQRFDLLANAIASAEYHNSSLLLIGKDNIGLAAAIMSYYSWKLAGATIDCTDGIATGIEALPNNTHLLLLYDLGREANSTEFSEYLRDWRKYYSKKVTPRLLITTELSMQELQHRYGTHIMAILQDNFIVERF